MFVEKYIRKYVDEKYMRAFINEFYKYSGESDFNGKWYTKKCLDDIYKLIKN